MFIPGETVTHKFYIPFVRSDIQTIYVTYKQDNRIVLTKSVSGNNVYSDNSSGKSYFDVTLSQQQSLLFKDDYEFTIQINIAFKSNGTRCTSKEIKGSSGVQHIREVVN